MNLESLSLGELDYEPLSLAELDLEPLSIYWDPYIDSTRDTLNTRASKLQGGGSAWETM